MAKDKQQKETDAIKQKLESLIATMGSPSTPNLTGLPSGGGDGTSKIERQVAKKDELEKKIRRMIMEERQLRKELEQLIETLKNPDEQTVIEMHYLDHVKWWPICAALFSGEADYAEKADKYLKRTFKLHGSALQALAKIYAQTKESE